MNFFNGGALADSVLEETKTLIGSKRLSLGIVSIGENEISQRFITEKEKRGHELGVSVKHYSLASENSKALRRRLAELVKKSEHDGWIVQLPLPRNVNAQYVLNSISEAEDIDCLSQKSLGALAAGRSKILPPVVAAVKTLLGSQQINLVGKKIVILGAGRLVGRPVSLWLLSQNLPFAVLTEESKDMGQELQKADVIISGVGKPGLIRGNMVSDGAVIIDAGTAMDAGSLKGDADAESLKSKDGWLSPVPGGVGPLTIAHIFKNLVVLASRS
ncbi:MAG: bifunctional 5,10-methylenetetrahydrofolate dehydrogenase/5,10-methenyltetrahydrofolate cyclohydrolase [Candidatus Sungbacteria bacterium]|nr:bifunctional 5,10-methylenetetrahydrofolate dehydrogenase/5,10-methenyltetrahydrofolate cyclohydrolase [Candidatus Sungbacteria bacterium]